MHCKIFILKQFLSNKHSQSSKVKCFAFIFRTEPRPVFYATVTIVFFAGQISPFRDRSTNELPYWKKLQVRDLTTVVFYGKPVLAKGRYYNGT